MTDLGERLREERERLGLSQTALAESTGVGLRSQRNYEKGERAPDAPYLQALAAAGADVQYVLTGMRADAKARLAALDGALAAAAARLTDYHDVRELGARLNSLIEHYLDCATSDRDRIDQLAALLADLAKKTKPPVES